MSTAKRLSIAASLAVSSVAADFAAAQRAVGIDVSAWQGTINWTSVKNAGKQFAFIRSSRGGTTGFYNQNDPENTQGLNTLSQRYDDPFFVSNMTNATAQGLLAGPYHFARADIIATTMNANGIANTGLDEANHFLQQAGNHMKPGFLRPVLDLEAGASQRTRTELTNFALEFVNRIYEVKGVYPIVYASSSYATDEVDSRIATNTDLWIARWPNQANPESIDIHNINPPPASGYPNVYGVWNPSYPNTPTPHPWDFWQYASTGRVPGIGGGTANVDLDVYNGTIEQLREQVIPAIWLANASGSWSDATKWNSNPGLPGANDRVIIDRSAGVFTITLSGGNYSIKSLQTSEPFVKTGATLAVAQYVNFLNDATISGGSMSAASIANSALLTQSAGILDVAGDVNGTGVVAVSGGTFSAGRIRQTSLVSQGGLLKLDGAGLQVSSVAIFGHSGTGKVDLGDDALVINYNGTSPLPAVRTAVAGGYNGGAWDGDGINSSLAAADSRFAVGFALPADVGATTSWLGATIDATSILLRTTLYGDANLSATVDVGDFAIVAANFNAPADRWSLGDFNNDGTVGLGDFALMAANFNQSMPSQFARGAAIPEPTSVVAILALSLAAARRRPRSI